MILVLKVFTSRRKIMHLKDSHIRQDIKRKISISLKHRGEGAILDYEHQQRFFFLIFFDFFYLFLGQRET